uniref:Kinesin motor domain-containing protein n=1 Tax=Fagus sylvatica TaxID=28930 RepID=A0A2N9HRV7_FAGSY
MEQRLAGWKRMYLSKGGRVTLIKSTLSNIPTYYVSLFSIPTSVAQHLEKIQRDFLWGVMGEEFKYHLVSWDRVCKPLRYGGLGIKILVLFNQAFLGKWLWRYATEKEALWRKIVELKYGGMWGDWCSKSVQGPYGKSVWKSIRKGWPNFAANVNFRMGNGAHLKFWQHQWCGEIPLRLRFPELFQIASNPEASVKELARFDGTSFHWNVSFIRLVHDWELESVADFMDVLYSVIPTQEAIDTICWKLTFAKEDGESIDHLFLHCSVANELWQLVFSMFEIWWVMPYHVVDLLACWSGHTRKTRSAATLGMIPHCIMWVIWRGWDRQWNDAIRWGVKEILTIDNLRRRNVMVLDWCCMCKKGAESVEHLLLHCPFAGEIWSMVFGLFGVVWVMRTILELLDCWQGCFVQRQIGETSLNEASSRSHQILRLTIESSAREFLGNDKSSSLTTTVNFVDLAGSERASQSLAAGARLKEGCHINRSLLTLGTVIRKLSKGRNGHIPFRDSKLTHILQSSLGGNARTAIICTMSPARSHVEQSRNTLLFASCAKEVATNA